MKNIKILYVMKALYYSWFWLGIWVLYYVKFGGYWTVGLLETVMVISTIIFEIPTGAIADILGKKKTLFIAFLLAGIGQIWMGMSATLLSAIMSLVLLNLGGALNSGTFEAMIFDSLKDEGKDKKYMKVLSNMSSIQLITFALVSIVGGYLYSINNGLPYIANGIFEILGAFLALFLVEPSIDTEKFTLTSYVKQNLQGFKILFNNKKNTVITLALLCVSVITILIWEGLNDILAVEYGFSASQLGIVVAVASLLGAFGSYITGKIAEKKKNTNTLYFGALTLYILSILFSPFVGMAFGAITIFLRYMVMPGLENTISTHINENTDSKNRATTLSSYSLLAYIPYLLLIYPITAMVDHIAAVWIAFALGLLLILSLIWNYFVFRDSNHQD